MTDTPWLDLAMKEIGTKEAPGFANNPIVQQYYRDATGGGKLPDSVPWCAAFVGAMLKRSGVAPSGFLAARSYLNWGKKLSAAKPGCIVVFSRGGAWQGHVAFCVKDLGANITVLGGNQDDAVNIKTYGKRSVLGYRWPHVMPTPPVPPVTLPIGDKI